MGGAAGRSALADGLLAVRHAIPVRVAQRPRGVLGERIAVALAVGRPHERGDDLEAPLVHLAGLSPEVGETQVDVELEQVYAGRMLGGHGAGKSLGTPPDDILA